MKPSKRLCSALCLTMATAGGLDAVAERGRPGMPLSLERTTHVFAKTDDVGRRRGVAKDSADAEQIRLIREHLSEITRAFAQGDFSGTAA